MMYGDTLQRAKFLSQKRLTMCRSIICMLFWKIKTQHICNTKCYNMCNNRYTFRRNDEGVEMNKSAYVSVRIRPELKESSENILNELGITPTEAITMFYSQIKMRKGLPFPVEIPNNLTAQVFDEMDAGINVNAAASVDDLMAAIEG